MSASEVHHGKEWWVTLRFTHPTFSDLIKAGLFGTEYLVPGIPQPRKDVSHIV